MSQNKNSLSEDLVKIGLFLGGIWLGAKFLEALSERCPRCNKSLQGRKHCVSCGWRGQ